jgi:cytoskeletal protein RodZ
MRAYFTFRQTETTQTRPGSHNKMKVTTMNKFLLASVAVLGLAGAAVAQEAPAIYGNYEANILNSNGSVSGAPHSSIVSGQASATVPGAGAGFNINQSDNYSGK